MSRALFELTSRGTGAGGGDEVFTFAEQTTAAEGQLPLLHSITHKTGIVTPGAVLFNDEWTVALRDDGTAGQGTYLGRLLARLPYWRGRLARIYWADADQWLAMVVYSVTRERGMARFTLTTPIRESLDRQLSEFDRPAFLSSAVTATSNAFPLTGAVDAPSFIRIDDEIIATIAQSNVSSIAIAPAAPSPRGAAGTEAAAHESGARVHKVLHYRADAARVLERILAEELGLRSSMDSESFTEASAWFRNVQLEKYFTDSEKVSDVLKKLLELCGGALVYDEFDGRIRLVSQAVWERTGAATPVLGADNLIGDGADWSSSEQPQEQCTRCTVIYGTGEPLGSGENPAVLYVDAEAESAEEYAREIPREIDSPDWLDNADRAAAKNTAEIIAERTVQQFRDPPRRIVGLELFGAEGRAVRKGMVVRVRLPEFSQAEDGSSQVVEALVQSAQRDILENRTTVRLSAYGRYEADFAPDEIVITNRRFDLSIEGLFGFRTARFDGLIRVVGANAGVFGTGELVPAFRSGNLPAGTTIRIRAEQGAKIGGLSGDGARTDDAGNGGDVFHITSGEVTAETDDHPDSCIAPGGGGGPRGGRGANGTVNGGGSPGYGGQGQGWSTRFGLWIGNNQFAYPGETSERERMFGMPGGDGLGPTGGDGGLKGALTAPAGDGGDAGNAEDGGGGGGGAEGGEFGMPGETAGRGGDSGSVAGGAPSDPGAGGKLARVTGGSFSRDSENECIIGDIIGASTDPLAAPVVTVRPNKYEAVWTHQPVIGITPAIVIEEIGASSQTEALRSTSFAGVLTNSGSTIKNYRARVEFTGRTASVWVYFTLQPEVAATLADPVVTLSADGRRASFTNAETPAGNVYYVVEYLSSASNSYILYQRYAERAAARVIVNRGRGSQSYRVRAETLGQPVQNHSAWVTFTVKALFSGSLNASNNNLVVQAGSTVTYTLSVNEAPTSTATVTVTVGNTSIATADTTTFTITAANWQTAKTVTVTGVAAGMTTITATAAGSEYAGQSVVSTVSVAAQSGGLLAGPATATVQAGASVTVSYSLGAEPTADVLVELTSSDDDITITPANRTIPLSSWSTSTASFTVTASDDATPGTVTLTAMSSSGGYDDLERSTTLTVTEPIDGYVTVRASPSVSFSQSRIDLNGTTPRTFRIRTTGPAPLLSDTVVNVQVSMHSNTRAAGNIDLTPETIDYDYSQANWSETHDFTIQYDGTGPFALQDPDDGLVAAVATSGGVESASFLDLDRGD